MDQPRKPVFQVGIGSKGRDTAKYQVSSIKERPEKLVFQVVNEGQGNFIENQRTTTTIVRSRKLVSQVGLVRKTKLNKKNPWITAGIASSSSIQENLKRRCEGETTKTSRTGCDNSTIGDNKGKGLKLSKYLEQIATEKTSRTGHTSRQKDNKLLQ